MHEAGGSPKRPRPRPASADEDERKEFDEPVKKVGRRDEDATVVTIDQPRKAVGTDLYRVRYPIGERPTVGVVGLRRLAPWHRTLVHVGDITHAIGPSVASSKR
jgi:hypothetical protein